MSNTRDSNFYYEIVAALLKGLPKKGFDVPEDVIKSVLSELFDSVAIHSWCRTDVCGVARQAGWPISQTMADEILSDVEAHADPEYGITWLTFENAVDEFYAELDWEHLDPEEDERCIGTFLICLQPPDHPNASDTMLYLKRASFAEALKKAGQLVEKSGQSIICYGVPQGEEPSLDAEWLAQHAHKLWFFEPEENQERDW